MSKMWPMSSGAGQWSGQWLGWGCPGPAVLKWEVQPTISPPRGPHTKTRHSTGHQVHRAQQGINLEQSSPFFLFFFFFFLMMVPLSSVHYTCFAPGIFLISITTRSDFSLKRGGSLPCPTLLQSCGLSLPFTARLVDAVL